MAPRSPPRKAATPRPIFARRAEITSPAVVDSSSSFDDSILLGEAAPPPPPVPPAPLPPAPAPMHAACGETARSRTATLDRFDQWDAQIRASARPSLDRGALALDAAAWSGHCQELEVLRSALEQQLGCSVDLQGRCGALGEAR